MSSTNEENTTETEADTEGHGRKGYRIGEAGTEADTEGHLRTKASRVGEAGTEADTEGPRAARSPASARPAPRTTTPRGTPAAAAVADRPVAARSPEGGHHTDLKPGAGMAAPGFNVVELLDGSIAGGQLT